MKALNKPRMQCWDNTSKARAGLRLALFIFLFSPAQSQAIPPYWWIYAAPGSHTTGPGAGSSGKLTISPIETAEGTVLSQIWDGVLSFSEQVNTLAGDSTDKQDEVQKAIGESATGIDVDPAKLDVDQLNLANRIKMLEALKSSGDADKYQHFIAYAEALQAHESREQLFAERLNTLIKVNHGKLDWQQRVRLAAETGLLGGQHAIAQQQMVEIENRARVAGTVDRMKAAADERRRLQTQADIESMLGGP